MEQTLSSRGSDLPISVFSVKLYLSAHDRDALIVPFMINALRDRNLGRLVLEDKVSVERLVNRLVQYNR